MEKIKKREEIGRKIFDWNFSTGYFSDLYKKVSANYRSEFELIIGTFILSVKLDWME